MAGENEGGVEHHIGSRGKGREPTPSGPLRDAPADPSPGTASLRGTGNYIQHHGISALFADDLLGVMDLALL